MNRNKAVLLAKIQAVLGVDPVPVYGTNAILCEDPEIEILDKKLERNNVKPTFGAKAFVPIGVGVKITFTTELKGSGVGAGTTPPEIGVLFRGSNFAETIGANYVDYLPTSAGTAAEYVTLYLYRHNILHKVVDCRGVGPEVDLKVNEYGKVKWEFTGIWAGPTDDTIPAAPVFNTTLPPMFRGASFALHGYAGIIDALKISVKNEIAARPDANSATGIKEYFAKERSVTGECEPEAVSLATKNWWNIWESGDTGILTATVGGTAGNRCIISGPAAQIDKPSYGDRENLLTQKLPLVMLPTVAGDDEIKFRFN